MGRGLTLRGVIGLMLTRCCSGNIAQHCRIRFQ
jgi:hypothetical protein